MNLNLQSNVPVSATASEAGTIAAGIVAEMRERAHLMRGRPTPNAATTASWAGDLEQWATDLAAALELMRHA